MVRLIHWQKIYIIALLFSFVPASATNDGAINSNRWDGWHVDLSGGTFGVVQISEQEKTRRLGPTFEVNVGYRKSFLKNKKFYLEGNIGFNAFVPDAFRKIDFTFARISLHMYPIFFTLLNLLCSYNFSAKKQILLGTTYFRGLTIR